MSDNLINEEIRVEQVRLLAEDNTPLGIMARSQAQAMANEKELDLVLIAPQGVPPVCRLMDYGKHKFEMQKRDKENRKKQKIVTVKEIQLSYSIEDRDLEIKAKNAMRMLQGGDKVRVSIRFRGRQLAHTEIGAAILKRFAEACAECGTMERNPKFEGRSMSMFLSPKPPQPAK